MGMKYPKNQTFWGWNTFKNSLSTTDGFPIYMPKISEKPHSAPFITICFHFINLFGKNAKVEFKCWFFKILTFSEEILKKRCQKQRVRKFSEKLKYNFGLTQKSQNISY